MGEESGFSWLVGDVAETEQLVTWEGDPSSKTHHCVVPQESNIESEIKHILTRYHFTLEDKPLITDHVGAYIASFRALRAGNKRRETHRGKGGYELDHLLQGELVELTSQHELTIEHIDNTRKLLEIVQERGYTMRHIRQPAGTDVDPFAFPT